MSTHSVASNGVRLFLFLQHQVKLNPSGNPRPCPSPKFFRDTNMGGQGDSVSRFYNQVKPNPYMRKSTSASVSVSLSFSVSCYVTWLGRCIIIFTLLKELRRNMDEDSSWTTSLTGAQRSFGLDLKIWHLVTRGPSRPPRPETDPKQGVEHGLLH